MSDMITRSQVSAGGVAFREQDGQIEIAIISVGERNRWQLPKGRVDQGESTEVTAMREVQEEAGIRTELIQPVETIDYWFYINDRGQRVRVHKTVHFYLLRYQSGDPKDHDFEVNEARWAEIEMARKMLAFDSEKKVVQKAQALIHAQVSGDFTQ